jgi:hypothetical protein
MSPECKAEVVRDQNRMAQDYRLNWRLKTACKSDIGQLCDGLCNDKEGQMCGGVVLQCLQVGLGAVVSSSLLVQIHRTPPPCLSGGGVLRPHVRRRGAAVPAGGAWRGLMFSVVLLWQCMLL